MQLQLCVYLELLQNSTITKSYDTDE